MGPDNLVRALHPVLVAISHEVDELVRLGVPMDAGMLYTGRVECEHAIRVWSAVGQLIPMAALAQDMIPERAQALAATARSIAAPLLPDGFSLMEPHHRFTDPARIIGTAAPSPRGSGVRAMRTGASERPRTPDGSS